MDIQNILSKSTALSADQLRSVLASTSAVRPMTVGAALNQKEYTSAEELVSALCHAAADRVWQLRGGAPQQIWVSTQHAGASLASYQHLRLDGDKGPIASF